jgi:hypothetical protein
VKTQLQKEWDEILRLRGLAKFERVKQQQTGGGAFQVIGNGCIWNGLNHAQKNDVVCALQNEGIDYEARRID